MKKLYSVKVDVGGEKVESFLAKPSHSQIEDAEYVFGQKFNQLLNDGFLSRAMMNKKFNDIGGLFSKKTTDEISKKLLELMEAKKTIEFYGGAEKLSKEEEKELKEAEKAYAIIQKQITENDVSLEQMYSQSADSKAEEHMVKWYVLNNSYFVAKVKKGEELKEENFKLFEGANFEEKRQELDQFLEELEEEDDSLLSKKKKIVAETIVPFQRVIALWYNNIAEDQKSSEEGLKKFYSE